MTDADAPEAIALDPARRQRRPGPPPAGVPLASGGATWVLACRPTDPALAPARDRLYDEATAERRVDVELVYAVAATLLLEHYDLTAREAGVVLGQARPADVSAAAFDAALGPGWRPASWTDWVVSALLANGIDPASVPPPMLPYVLQQLVDTGRAAPADRFVHSLEFTRKRKDSLKQSERR